MFPNGVCLDAPRYAVGRGSRRVETRDGLELESAQTSDHAHELIHRITRHARGERSVVHTRITGHGASHDVAELCRAVGRAPRCTDALALTRLTSHRGGEHAHPCRQSVDGGR